ncbi:MAG: P-II family nitrogen regulator [Candidatus Muirbacterium halophilum]|nr:P-II family nitrogen regulator [Candidatus Muirbacterium halophilum]
MKNGFNVNLYEMIVIIVNFGKGSEIIQIAKKSGISGGTILLGKGTVKNKLLEWLDLNEVRKEIVLMIAPFDTVDVAMEQIQKKFNFGKSYSGIAFTIPVTGFFGSASQEDISINKTQREEKPVMFNSIFIIVDKGKGNAVMEIATKSGARGGTVINARGSGVNDTSMLFSFPIEPEKDIVLILAGKIVTENIVNEIRKGLEIDEPGKGIIFIQDVNKVYGVNKVE